MIGQEREDYRQAISLLLGALDARQLFPRDEAVRFAWEVMERYCAAALIDGWDAPAAVEGHDDIA